MEWADMGEAGMGDGEMGDAGMGGGWPSSGNKSPVTELLESSSGFAFPRPRVSPSPVVAT